MADTATIPDHPAKWSAAVLEQFPSIADAEATRIGRPLDVLDPFAGVGLGRLRDALEGTAVRSLVGVELQNLWVVEPGTVLGDATDLPFETGTFDAVFTSPCYGNRMADKHQANDPCSRCRGSGRLNYPTTNPGPIETCPNCKGSGLSRRNTYAHELRRQGSDLVDGSAAGLQWGRPYRRFHEQFITEMLRVLELEGLAVINMSNHFRGVDEQPVVEWWVNELIVRGCRLVEVRRVPTPRQRNGANGDRRVDGEVIIVVRTPLHRTML